MSGTRWLIATSVMVLLGPLLMSTPVIAEPPAPDWVVCGGLVAYDEQTAGLNSSRLMVVPALGGIPQVLWDDPDAAELEPAWSPNGQSIAFAGRITDGGVPHDNRLYVLRAGAAEPQIVVNQLNQIGGLRTPAWSPNGQRIAYITGVQPSGAQYRGQAWISVVDLVRDAIQVITAVPAGYFAVDLAWSPRGDQILVTGFKPPGNWAVYSLDPDAAYPSLTVLASDEDGSPSMGFPAFLPGGRSVLIERDELDLPASRLYLADPKLQSIVPVTGVPGLESQPDFGFWPDQAVYQQRSGTDSSIEVLTLSTGATRTLVPPAGGVFVEQPDWQPVAGCRPWSFGS